MANRMRPTGSWGNVKPSNCSIDWGDPLASGLIGFYIFDNAFRVEDLCGIGPNIDSSFGGLQTTYSANATGGGVQSVTSFNSSALLPASYRPSTNVTFVFRGTCNANTVGNQSLFGIADTTQGAVSITLGRVSGDNDSISIRSNGTNYGTANIGLSNRYFQPLQLAVAVDWAGGHSVLYDGATPVATNAQVGTITYNSGSSAVIRFGGQSAVGCVATYGALWNRTLRPEEIARLAVDPYAFVILNRAYFFGPSNPRGQLTTTGSLRLHAR